MVRQKLWTKNFITTSMINFLVYLVYYLLMIMIAGYAMENLHASPSQAGLAVGIFIVGALISRIITGSIIEQAGRKKMLYIGLFVYLIATLLYFKITGLHILFLIRLIHGIGFGIASISTGTIAANIIPDERRGEGIGYYALSTTLASAIGPFLGMFLNEHMSFYAILILCIFLLAIGCGATLFLKLPRTVLVKEQLGNRGRFSPSNFIEYRALPIALIGAVAGLSYSSIISFLSSYAKEVNLVEVGSFFFIVYSVAILISRPFTGRWFDSKGENHVMYPSFLMFAVGLVILSQAHQSFILLLSGAFIGVGFGTFLSGGQTIAIKLSSSHRVGLATSTFLAITDVGVGIGPFFLGILVPTIGFSGLYKSMACLVIVSMILYHFLHGKRYVKSSTAILCKDIEIYEEQLIAEE